MANPQPNLLYRGLSRVKTSASAMAGLYPSLVYIGLPRVETNASAMAESSVLWCLPCSKEADDQNT